MRSQYAPAQTAGDSDDDATAARNLEAGKGSGVRKKKDTGPRDVFGDLDSIVVRTICVFTCVCITRGAGELGALGKLREGLPEIGHDSFNDWEPIFYKLLEKLREHTQDL